MRLDEFPTKTGISDYDWAQLFPSSGDEWTSYSYTGMYSVYDGARVEDITPERVARVDAWWANVDDGVDLVALVELTDSTWGAVMAWCDYTGWDCQSGVQWKWARSREIAISNGLDRESRERLGLVTS